MNGESLAVCRHERPKDARGREPVAPLLGDRQ
jgi:hypothetical protein